MTLALASGALITLEQNERAMWIRLKAALAAGDLLSGSQRTSKPHSRRRPA